jgi:hypothetical protein
MIDEQQRAILRCQQCSKAGVCVAQFTHGHSSGAPLMPAHFAPADTYFCNDPLDRFEKWNTHLPWIERSGSRNDPVQDLNSPFAKVVDFCSYTAAVEIVLLIPRAPLFDTAKTQNRHGVDVRP